MLLAGRHVCSISCIEISRIRDFRQFGTALDSEADGSLRAGYVKRLTQANLVLRRRVQGVLA
ncbi:MAG TPA: hypothetical protein VG966_05070 [Hyphomicrobiaceae bacterium]|nr:hypothetical protein [Hyphomicrobiaceae bacterium]